MTIRETKRSLSRNEAAIVLDLEWRGARLVSLADLRKLLRASPAYSRFMAHRLVQKGWLQRLRRGVYRLVPADRGREGVGDTNPLIAGIFLKKPFFYSYGTACSHHGLTRQAFTEFAVACRERRRPAISQGIRYVFIHQPESRFFGFELVKILGETYPMATRERAMLDALDHPELAGGIGEVSLILAKGLKSCRWPVMLDALKRWRQSSMVQRLGYFARLHGIAVRPSVLRELRSLMRPNVKIHLGPRARWGTRGALDADWNVLVNVPLEVLREGGMP